MNILCRIGLHKWPRWTTRKPSGGVDYSVRRCKRCGKRQIVDKVVEANEAALRG